MRTASDEATVIRVQHQRTDVLPLTWEIPTTIAVTWLLGVLLSLPVGQGLAHAVTGKPFAWPAGQVPQSVLGLVTGHPGTGLPDSVGVGPPAIVVYASIGVLECLLTVLIPWVTCVWWRTLGPGAQLGLASRHEVCAVLGRAQLRRRRKVIRPDLHQATGFGRRGRS